MSVIHDWNEHNRGVIKEFRANGGKDGLLLLTTTGAKSGATRVNPLNYTRDGEHIILIASKAASPTHPDWYHNLVANPEVIVEVGSEGFQARASIAEGEERQRLFDQQSAQMPFFAEYQKRTTRQIPVIILERIT